MPNPELVEAVARAIDPLAWDERAWMTARDAIEQMHLRRQIACRKSEAALKAHEEYLAEQGLVVVPKEPSAEMIGALNGGSLPFGFSAETVRQESVAIWQAMVATHQKDQYDDR